MARQTRKTAARNPSNDSTGADVARGSVSAETGHKTTVKGSSVKCAGCRWTFDAPDASDDGKRLARDAAAVHEGRPRRSSE